MSMPYIPEEQRSKFLEHLDTILNNINTKGELTYCLYYLLVYSFECNIIYQKMGYEELSNICAAGQDATNEFRRKLLDKYEDKKIKENGDV